MDNNREGKTSKKCGSKKLSSKYLLLEVKRLFRWRPDSFFDLA